MMRQFTIERLAFVSLLALLFAMALRPPVDTDTWWHVRSGEYTLTQGMIYADPFSYTYMDAPWVNHSWGAQLIMSGAYEILGDAGLMLFQAVLSVAGMTLLFLVSKGSVYARAFIVILGASAASIFWSARPQMITFFFSTFIIYLIYDAKQNQTARWYLLLPVMWLWSNLHAGWSIGYIFLGALIVGEILNQVFKTGDDTRLSRQNLRQLILFTVVSLPLLVLSPYGLDNLLVPFNTVNIGALRDFIQEWNSPNFQGRETWTFVAMIALLFMALWGSRRTFDWTGWFLIAGTLFMALLYGRNIAVFAVVAVPFLAQHFDDWLTRLGWVVTPRRNRSRRQGQLNAILAVVIVGAIGVYALGLFIPSQIAEAQAETLPVDAVAHLQAESYEGPIFNSYNWGGYLIKFAPDYPVFIDGRTDLYGEFLRTYVETTTAQGDWRATLDAYGVNLVLVETQSRLGIILRDDVQWQLVYEDDLAVMYTRKPSSVSEGIR